MKRKVRDMRNTDGTPKRGIIQMAEAALAPRLAMGSAPTHEHVTDANKNQETLDGMLFVPVRPSLKGAA